MTDAPSKSFTGRLRDAEKVVRARSDVSSTEFRVFTAVLSGLNEASGTFDCSDEVMAVIAGFKQRQSLSAARAGLQRKRIIWFRAGRPGRLTRYGLSLSDNEVDDGIALLKDAKDEARAKLKRDGERRVGVKDRLRRQAAEHARADAADQALRKELATPNPTSACDSVYAAASTDLYTVLPRHTPSLSSSTDRRLDSEHVREAAHPDDGDVTFMSALGDGDLTEGRDLADYLPLGIAAEIINRVRQFGLQDCMPQIRFAQEQAIARRDAARRASA